MDTIKPVSVRALPLEPQRIKKIRDTKDTKLLLLFIFIIAIYSPIELERIFFSVQ